MQINKSVDVKMNLEFWIFSHLMGEILSSFYLLLSYHAYMTQYFHDSYVYLHQIIIKITIYDFTVILITRYVESYNCVVLNIISKSLHTALQFNVFI